MAALRSGLVLACSVLLLVGGVTVVFFDDAGYRTEVVVADEAPDEDEIYNSSELSEDGRVAFLDAYRAMGSGDTGVHIGYDESHEPSEFAYDSDWAPIYYVRYEGTVYRVETTQVGGHGMGFGRIINGGLAAILGLAGLGVGVRWSRDRRVTDASLGGIVAGIGVAFAGPIWPGKPSISAAIAVGFALSGLVAAIVWGVSSRLRAQ